jgi:hypothetical protein
MVEKLEMKERDDDSVEGGRRDVGDGRDHYKVKVVYDGVERELSFRDPVVEGRKVLREAKLESPDDYVLIALENPGTRSVGLDEEVDLREPGRERFVAFQSDRLFTFTVDERGYEWGAARISEPTLRDIAAVPDRHDLILEREDEPDLVLRKGSELDLSARGTEHLRIRKRPDSFEVTVIYNGQKKPLRVSNAELIRDILARAITLFGSLPNPHTLALYTADKGELKDEWTVKEAGLTPHEEVLLRPSTVKAG